MKNGAGAWTDKKSVQVPAPYFWFLFSANITKMMRQVDK